MNRASIPALKRAVTRLIREELAMASFQADFEEGKASGGDMQWQARNLEAARTSYNRRMTMLEEELCSPKNKKTASRSTQ